MTDVFVDTWAWLALAMRDDEYHQAAKQQHSEFLTERRRYVTTDYVIGELITQLYREVDSVKAEAFVAAVFKAVYANIYTLECVSSARFEEAWQMRRRFSDKPTISFVNFTSFVVMRELNINDVFTGDKHFLQVNQGFRMLPAS